MKTPQIYLSVFILFLYAGTAFAQLPPLMYRIAPVDTAVDTTETIAAATADSVDKEHGQAFEPKNSGLMLPGVPELNRQPLTLEMLVKIDSAKSYNILAAHEPKSSPRHWELFTMPVTGFITVYMPGNNPDHLHTKYSIADGNWHKVILEFRDNKAALSCNGQFIGSIPLNRPETKTPDNTVFAVGSLVEGRLACSGTIDNLRVFGENEQLLLSCDFEPLTDSMDTKPENKLSPSMQKVCEQYGIKPQKLLYRIDGKIGELCGFTAGIRSSLIERLFPTSGEAVEPKAFNENPQDKPYKDVPRLTITTDDLRKAVQDYRLDGINAEEFRPAVLAYWGEMFADLQNQISGTTKLPRGAAEQVYDKQALILPEEIHPAQVVLRRCTALLLLGSLPKNETTQRLHHNLKILSEAFAKKQESDWTTGDYAAVCALRRQIMFADPAVNSLDKIMFLARANYAGSRLTNQFNTDRMGGHFATQNYGFNTIHGGGIFTIENWRAKTPIIKDLIKGRTISSGIENRLVGKQLDYGSFNCPRLDYDGETVYFAHNGSQEHRWLWTPDTAWHIFKMNINGSDITQLTDGAFNDFDPCPMPDGRVVFISERRGGFIRCFAESAWLRVTTYTLHSMKNNGSDVYPISYFETSEWQPSVDNNGMLVYTRWDYTDRENCLGSNFWTCFPDGRNPRAPHGNYPLPWHTLKHNPLSKINGTSAAMKEMDDYDKGKPLAELVDDVNFLVGKKHGDHRFGNCPDAPSALPMTEMQIKAIPDSHKYIFTAAPHHGETFGSLCILDLREKNDYHMNQVRRITPYVPFPESESPGRSQYRYGSPYPLNENTFLCNSWEELVLLDRFGNEELICEREILPVGYDARLRLTEPTPVQARKRPPVIPQQTAHGVDNIGKTQTATIGIVNVNVSDLPLPKDRPIKAVRVFQVFPKPNPWMNQPDIGYAPENTPRMPLGVVPVEDDGSVFFEAPPKKQLLFQTLDANGAAVQTMRAVAVVHPGEQLFCTGCHEQTNETLPNISNAKAFRRPPSKLQTEIKQSETGEPEPVSFYRTVKPVFEKSCVECHRKQQAGPEKMDFADLKKYVFFFAGGMMKTTMTSGESGGSRSMPGSIGAANSRLGQVLLDENHREVVSAEDRLRIFLWLDANAPRLGAFVDEEKQKRGELVLPVMDME
ncbi:MAG: hypothetical protein FWE67_09800 [Planctomycetaceae bacterium]|nr:hypothetical protein [Planctomycetaceae bacterium]